MSRKRIVFATSNMNKMREIREIMSDIDVDIVSMREIGFTDEIVEDGKTFEENALIKAKTISERTGEIVLADDSGIEIDYLDGAPGIYSARFLGEDTKQEIKNRYIIEKLEGVPEEKRTARFVCVIALVGPNISLTKRETLEGKIGHKESGSNGFGYDPIFVSNEMQVSNAELTLEEKNRISHRGKALRAMKEELKKLC